VIESAHGQLLSAALVELLGEPTAGDVAFLRCLPSELVDALIDTPDFAVRKWTISAVVDTPGTRRITADQAVEQREDKADPALFLIDPLRAGAGLDGIYNAAREISEAELFGVAHEKARRRLRGKAPFLRAAQRRAERLGRRHQLTPWQVFDFLIAVDSTTPGAALCKLGLWPIARDGTPDDSELELSAALADRLLFAQDGRSIGDRVRALLLNDPSGDQGTSLERFLRDAADRGPLQAAQALAGRPDMWLGPLQPRFSGEALQAIKLLPWRGPRGDLAKWSGLREADEPGGSPRLILDRDAAAKETGQLEVRWITEPEQLAKGSVQYRVTVMAGDEELAEQTLVHKDRPPQRAVFGLEDFEDLDPDAKFEAFIQISAVAAEGVEGVRSEEEFILEFGQTAGKASAASGQIFRTLADGAIAIATRELFNEAIVDGHLPPRASEDKKGYIGWRGEGGRSIRVLRPALIRLVEEDWRARNGAVGRWVARVRADGSPAGPLDFTGFERGVCDPGPWDRVVEVSRKLALDLGPLGLLARIQGARWPAADGYVNGWIAALESGAPELALHGTVEVQALSGRTLGLIVTPLHPLRLAWHGLYDHLTAHARYEQGLSAAAVQNALNPLDSSHFPATLPGTGTSGFVFADTLGFHAVAMTYDDDPEPKASVALLTMCLGGGQQSEAPSIGTESATVLAREIGHYLDCHRRRGETGTEGLGLLNLQAWRPGDGMTVARAMGEVLRRETPAAVDDEDEREAELCFTLDLFHSSAASSTCGGFLSNVGRRRRSGGGVLDANDRWMTETARRPGEIIVPRLRWARRNEETESTPAHVSLAFDVFEARLEPRPAISLGDARPLHAFGLSKNMERRVELGGDPEWTVFSPPKLEGEKAPDNRTGTDRLLRLDAAVLRATARFLGGGPDDWPVLSTRLPTKSQRWIDQLHSRSDWVVTIDRNACVEYFDAPRGLPHVYERFVIDAVPERTDLGALQLVTSTSNLDEVRDLVDAALGDMGLSSSERNSRFLLTQLKALSGRLAIRLANPAGRTGEMIALALMQAHCAQYEDVGGAWLDLTQGFFLPVDEIADLAPVSGLPDPREGLEGGRRADFIHVRAPARGPLEFRFVEVKHRLHLKTARQPDLLHGILRQTGDLRRRWNSYFFGHTLKPAERALRRSQLARILRFYADRASRHRLSAAAKVRLTREIDQILLKEGYQPADLEYPDVGYVFCPEHRSGRPELLYAKGGEDARLWLFGPSLLPDERAAAIESPNPAPEADESVAEALSGSPVQINAEGIDDKATEKTPLRPDDPDLVPLAREKLTVPTPSRDAAVDILLGEAVGGGDDVAWRVSIRANPHLMMVGLPGMGKTTSLINICRQLVKAGITPIVFSYHDDIDTKLAESLGNLNLVDYNGLGFNPLRIDAPQPTAHVDVAGTLRDIFSSIFSDLGDLQLEELRQAIKQSYDDVGWGGRSDSTGVRTTPPFRAFFDILSAKSKPNLGLLARLQELADYGFFDGVGERASLLEERRPTIVRIHGTTNAILQNAFSSFVLYSLYKDMFRRGVQSRITHAVIFDEAHRAARLKLIPQFAKECRKFGLAFALASQEAKDFNDSLFSAVGSYLVLRVTETDARTLARKAGSTLDEKRTADRLKALERYTALFFGEGRSRPIVVRLMS
jgi:DNA phosphorothioation-dependent restriction protein DptH